MSRKRSRYEVVSVDRIPIAVSARDYAVLLARVVQALYPYLTSSASPENSAEIIGGPPSSSLHLPEIAKIGSPASEEVSEYVGKKPAA